MDPINVDFTGGKPDDGKKTVADIFIPPEHAGRKIAINILLTGVLGAVLYYIMLPPLNFKAVELYLYIAFVLFIYLVLTVLSRPNLGLYVLLTVLGRHLRKGR